MKKGKRKEGKRGGGGRMKKRDEPIRERIMTKSDT